MYNSYTINLLVKTKDVFASLYKYSILKLLVDKIVLWLKKGCKGSKVCSFFTNEKSIIKNSYIYLLYKKIVDFINKLLFKLKRKVNSCVKGSYILNVLKKDMNTDNALYIIIIGFNVTLLSLRVFNIISLRIVSISMLAFITFFSLFLYINNAKTIEMLKNSWIINTIISVFTLDDGGEEWW